MGPMFAIIQLETLPIQGWGGQGRLTQSPDIAIGFLGGLFMGWLQHVMTFGTMFGTNKGDKRFRTNHTINTHLFPVFWNYIKVCASWKSNIPFCSWKKSISCLQTEFHFSLQINYIVELMYFPMPILSPLWVYILCCQDPKYAHDALEYVESGSWGSNVAMPALSQDGYVLFWRFPTKSFPVVLI